MPGARGLDEAPGAAASKTPLFDGLADGSPPRRVDSAFGAQRGV